MRKDLSGPQQVVQACHATIESLKSFPISEIHPSVIVLGVTPIQLSNVHKHLENNNILYKTFTEPDIGNQLTAIATEIVSGSKRKSFKKFQLLKEAA